MSRWVHHHSSLWHVQVTRVPVSCTGMHYRWCRLIYYNLWVLNLFQSRAQQFQPGPSMAPIGPQTIVPEPLEFWGKTNKNTSILVIFLKIVSPGQLRLIRCSASRCDASNWVTSMILDTLKHYLILSDPVGLIKSLRLSETYMCQ